MNSEIRLEAVATPESRRLTEERLKPNPALLLELVQVLGIVQELLSIPSRWIKNEQATTLGGEPVKPCEHNAWCFCVTGALEKAICLKTSTIGREITYGDDNRCITFLLGLRYLELFIPVSSGHCAASLYNDTSSLTHQDMLSWVVETQVHVEILRLLAEGNQE